ncbi:MAG: restriction endonuclease subunit S [Rhizobiaceae bacterium]
MSWRDCTLGEVMKLQRGHDLPDRLRVSGDVPIISSSGITGSHNVAKAAPPGVVTGRYGTIGEVFFSDEPYWPLNTALYVVEFKGNDPKFSAYLLRNTLKNYKSEKAAVPGVDRNVLHLLKVRAPSLSIQHRIVSILSAYDDLIETNRRRIALLEEAARLLYREWFIHFRFPGHEHVPLTDGLPDGWERRPLGEVADVRLGKMLDEKKNRGELRPYLANVNVRWGRFEFDNLREMRFEEHELEKYRLLPGDIVMCEGGEPGRCAIWKDQLPCMMVQKALHRIRPHAGLDYRFLYHCLSFTAKSGRLTGLFTGATIKHLPREKLVTVPIVVPLERFVRSFTDYVAPMEEQIGTLEAANRRATEARDLLLPRLMNGEIAV